jgi:SAM-dependent methyltransferase
MQERHSNRERYFVEQGLVTERYIIPYIQTVKSIDSTLVIGEIGCGEAGNMRPFLDMGCTVVGIDLSPSKIENGKLFYANHPQKENLTLIAEDIYKLDPASVPQFDVIVLRDVIEHIPHQEQFMKRMRDFLKPGGVVFFGFPPWCMPFGGHQQLCKSKFLSLLPYYHLLPRPLYKGILKLFGESPETIEVLMEVVDTRISINRFNRIVSATNYSFIRKDLYFINPGYEIKFKLKVRKLWPFMNIPLIRDFFATTYYSVIQKNEH